MSRLKSVIYRQTTPPKASFTGKPPHQKRHLPANHSTKSHLLVFYRMTALKISENSQKSTCCVVEYCFRKIQAFIPQFY